VRAALLRWIVAAPPALLAALALSGSAAASGQSILQQVQPLLWTLIALSVGGAAITYAFLVYAIWRFRDPSTRRRNYG
jgi:hypothetical protein